MEGKSLARRCKSLRLWVKSQCLLRIFSHETSFKVSLSNQLAVKFEHYTSVIRKMDYACHKKGTIEKFFFGSFRTCVCFAFASFLDEGDFS